MGKAAGLLRIAGDAFDGSDPDIPAFIFGYLLYDIAADAPGVAFLAVIEHVEKRTVVEVESIPGRHPEQVAGVTIELIDGTVRETVTIVEILQVVGFVSACFCLDWRKGQ